MADLVLFQPDGVVFEESGRMNGGRYWSAREFMAMLGYESYQSFAQAINRAIGTCTTLSIPVLENFQQISGDADGTSLPDYKLSRFACYLVAMNGDVRKPAVAAAQAYFASLAEAARQYMEAASDVERVQIRDEITDRERSLSSTARQSGVEQYQFFQNEGYRGMYNMNMRALKEKKGLPGNRSMLDFMGKRELAGNLFRITETEAKLKAEHTRGQKPAEHVAFTVGQKVRRMMIETDGTRPETLPLAGDIKDVRKGLKETAKKFTKLDRTTAPRTLPPGEPTDA